MIHLQNVSRWYGQVIGLNDVTCDIGPGLTALLGMNGAGKSTMMRLLTGQLKPTTGTVSVLGMEPFANPELYKRMGYCPEIDNFYEHNTGRQFVYFLARLGGFSNSEAKDRTQRMLELVFGGKKSAQAGLDAAVERGNRLLRQFERANPDR